MMVISWLGSKKNWRACVVKEETGHKTRLSGIWDKPGIEERLTASDCADMLG